MRGEIAWAHGPAMSAMAITMSGTPSSKLHPKRRVMSRGQDFRPPPQRSSVQAPCRRSDATRPIPHDLGIHWASPFRCSGSDGNLGSSAIPHFGQLPGPDRQLRDPSDRCIVRSFRRVFGLGITCTAGDCFKLGKGSGLRQAGPLAACPRAYNSTTDTSPDRS